MVVVGATTEEEHEEEEEEEGAWCGCVAFAAVAVVAVGAATTVAVLRSRSWLAREVTADEDGEESSVVELRVVLLVVVDVGFGFEKACDEEASAAGWAGVPSCRCFSDSCGPILPLLLVLVLAVLFCFGSLPKAKCEGK